MASTLVVHLTLFAGLFTTITALLNHCRGYFGDNKHWTGFFCFPGLHCCGTCDHRYCCIDAYAKLSDHDQYICANTENHTGIIIGSVTGSVVFLVISFACCFGYKRWRRFRSGARVTNTNVVRQQPVVQQIPLTEYQPPVHTQQIRVAPPPPYKVAVSKMSEI